jgi:hypothetical protein
MFGHHAGIEEMENTEFGRDILTEGTTKETQT